MKKIYQKMLKFAKPYYKNGRVYSLYHISWMLKKGEKIAKKNKIEKKFLIPLIILHDIGYGRVKLDFKDKYSKRYHMRQGVKVAERILKKVDYDKKLSKKIIQAISVHDNWIFDDNKPFKNKEMALFNDLDFLWLSSNFKVFKHLAKSSNMEIKKFYNYWLHNKKLIDRPFCCKQTKNIFYNSMKKIKFKIYDS